VAKVGLIFPAKLDSTGTRPIMLSSTHTISVPPEIYLMDQL